MSDQPMQASPSVIPDWIERVTDKVSIEHLDNNWITVMHFADFKRETIDEWLSMSTDVMADWPQGKPNFLCLDVTTITLSDVPYLVGQMSKQRGRRNDVDVYIVLWLGRSLAYNLLNALGRTKFVLNGKTRRQLVGTRADALRWLRYHLAQHLRQTAVTTKGTQP